MDIVVTYSIKTGQIFSFCKNTDYIEAEREDAKIDTSLQVAIFSESADSSLEDWYVDLSGPTLVRTKELDTLEVNNGVISGIPNHTLVIWPDGVMTTESGTLEFESNVSGNFEFIFRAIQYKELILEIEYNV
jgi:hypothetical protein